MRRRGEGLTSAREATHREEALRALFSALLLLRRAVAVGWWSRLQLHAAAVDRALADSTLCAASAFRSHSGARARPAGIVRPC